MITRKNEDANILPFKKAASEAFAFNDVVTTDANGYLTKATASTPVSALLGLIQRTVASTDLDYTSNTMVEVDVFCCSEDIYEATVDTGTAVQSHVNTSVDLNDENGINVNSNSQKAFKVTKIISASKVEGTFNVGYGRAGIRSINQVITAAQLTDGGGASGTKTLSSSIPKGAVVVQSFLTDITGFAGDTSAVVTIGDGSDVDRYNTGTPNVFATATDISAGVPSGTAFHAAAVAPVVTVTSATDITSVISNGAGQMTVTILYYVPR